MLYNNHYGVGHAGEMQFLHNLVKAINGEYSAIICYEQLARLAPTEEARKQILEIREDEIRHFQVFCHIYQMLTGRQHTPQMTEQCKDNFIDGVQASFKDEQETTDFYLSMADNTRDPYIQEQFRRAAADEQNHAVWFLYFLTSNRS